MFNTPLGKPIFSPGRLERAGSTRRQGAPKLEGSVLYGEAQRQMANGHAHGVFSQNVEGFAGSRDVVRHGCAINSLDLFGVEVENGRHPAAFSFGFTIGLAHFARQQINQRVPLSEKGITKLGDLG